MLPLRFPNSCIRAKVFVRKIGFKLRVMRLNHEESFYAFLLRFHNEDSEERGPATVSPHAGLAAHGQAAAKAPCKEATGCGQGQPTRGGNQPQGQQPVGVAPVGRSAARRHNRLQRGTRKGGRL
ncbi:hypothetical protein GW17_00061884 [Ensete ventricosum]|nr:hypothetical protein GW17_00061884 [Ensete ventricosum]RZS29298.1 hypothetical protein BHM03_00063011 [Ensete ventricosum]